MNSLEILLNKLIALGWKPFGEDRDNMRFVNHGKLFCKLLCDNPKDTLVSGYTYNDLCSIDSGLWQFVLDEKLVNIDDDNYFNIRVQSLEKKGDCLFEDEYRSGKQSYYRIMLSSIQPDKERFLLDNIKIDD